MNGRSSLQSNAGFVSLWSARVVSRFGSALGYVVLIWYVFAETGSALAVVYVGLAEFLPTVAFALFSGALVDRYPRRTVVMLSTLARSAAMGALVLALYLLGFNLPVIVLASAVFAVCATFFGPGSQALLSEIVAREDLDRANGIFESSESIVGIVGSALAGILVLTVGAVPSLGVDAAAYLVAALFIASIAGTIAAKGPTAETERLLPQVKEGLSYLRRATGLLELTVVALVSNFLFSIVLTFLVGVHGTVAPRDCARLWGAGSTPCGRLGNRRPIGRSSKAYPLHRQTLGSDRADRRGCGIIARLAAVAVGGLPVALRYRPLAGDPECYLAQLGAGPRSSQASGAILCYRHCDQLCGDSRVAGPGWRPHRGLGTF